MEHNAPLVSVIMPAYNAARFIEEAIRSVMAQTMTNWELLVIDDGSSDETARIAEALAAEDGRIRFLRNKENMGVARTRNRGFDLCRGSYVALLDSDDVWYPEKLERQLECLRREDGELCYCSYAIVDAQGCPSRRDYIVPERVDFEGLLRENVIGCSTVLMKRGLLQDRRFRTDFYHEDYVLWLTLLQAGHRAVGCTQPLVKWRLIVDSRSFDKRKAARNRWRIYRGCFELPLGKSLRAFTAYAVASMKKYGGKVR